MVVKIELAIGLLLVFPQNTNGWITLKPGCRRYSCFFDSLVVQRCLRRRLVVVSDSIQFGGVPQRSNVDDVFQTLAAQQGNSSASPPPLSIIIPAYNEEHRINETLRRYRAFLSNSKLWQAQSDIWVVDDGSSDGTSASVFEFGKNSSNGANNHNVPFIPVHCLTMETNQGKGAAIARGMLELATISASNQQRIVLVADADASGDISCLNEMWYELNKLLLQGNDDKANGISIPTNLSLTVDQIADDTIALPAALVVGKRYSPDISLLRWWLRMGFRSTVRIACGDLGVTDTQCGFKLMTLEAGKCLYRDLHLSRWTHDVEVLIRAREWKIPVSEYPVPWKDQDGSKLVQPSKLIQLVGIIWVMLWQVLRLRWEYDVTGNWKTNVRS